MFCAKCGAENPEGSTTCSSCGSPIAGDAQEVVMPGKLATIKLMVQADPALTLIIVGSLLVILGAFLPWVSVQGSGVLGINAANGSALLVVGVLCMSILMIARSGATGPWNIVMFLLNFLALALVFQALYWLRENLNFIAGGYWISMIGVLGITGGTAVDIRKGMQK